MLRCPVKDQGSKVTPGGAGDSTWAPAMRAAEDDDHVNTANLTRWTVSTEETTTKTRFLLRRSRNRCSSSAAPLGKWIQITQLRSLRRVYIYTQVCTTVTAGIWGNVTAMGNWWRRSSTTGNEVKLGVEEMTKRLHGARSHDDLVLVPSDGPDRYVINAEVWCCFGCETISAGNIGVRWRVDSSRTNNRSAAQSPFKVGDGNINVG